MDPSQPSPLIMMARILSPGGLLLLLLGLAAGHVAPATPEANPRLLVLTDIGQDPDDQQSLVRLLLYANEFDLEGLVATADNNSDREPPVIRADIIHEAIRRYGEVLPNLRLHDWRYPPAEALQSLVKEGNPWGGNSVPAGRTIGEGRDTAGSEWIIRQGDRPDPRPLDITLWGGASDLAQALWKVRKTRSATETRAFVRRLRVFGINDQDSTNAWIREQFPELFYIRGQARIGGKFDSGYRGMFLEGDYRTLSREWLLARIKSGRGPLMEYYPEKAYTQANPHQAIKEGDTPSFFYFLRNGLHEPGDPAYGGWGGRYGPQETYFQDVADTIDGKSSYRTTVWRWRPHFQNDFAARADWCVKPFSDANHAPIALLNGDRTRRIVHLGAAAGAQVRLSAEGSVDPDGDQLTYRWWFYPEAGTAAELPEIANSTPQVVEFRTLPLHTGATLHLILEVTDDGAPPLVSYRRIVLRVR